MTRRSHIIFQGGSWAAARFRRLFPWLLRATPPQYTPEVVRDAQSSANVPELTPGGADDGQPAAISLTPSVELVSGRVGKLLVLRKDTGVSHSIKTSGVWAPRDLDLFAKLIKPGMFVADVGAYIGHHSVYFSQLVGPEGTVVAFEPQRIPFRALNGNLLLNDCNNVDAFNCALGAKAEPSELWPHKEKANFGAVPIVVKKAGLAPQITYKGEISVGQGGPTIEVSTLDLMLAHYRQSGRRLGFAKIDVQAFELFVLQGAIDILTHDRPLLFFEVSPYWMQALMGYDYMSIYELLHDHGYRVVDPFGNHRTSTTRRWSGDQDEEWDCLAIPDD